MPLGMSLFTSILVHGLVLTIAWTMPAVTPARPFPVVIGISSVATLSSPEVATSAPRESPKEHAIRPITSSQPEEIAALPEREPTKVPKPEPPAPREPSPVLAESKPTPAPVQAVSTPAMVSSRTSAGADVDRLPDPIGTNPAPIYPDIARQNGWQGRVVLRVLVTAEGRVGAISVHKTSGHAELDLAALDVVRRDWRFHPGLRGGIPFASEIGVPVEFKLRSTP